jgi:hypothetical protein
VENHSVAIVLRKAYALVGVVLMTEFALSLYYVAGNTFALHGATEQGTKLQVASDSAHEFLEHHVQVADLSGVTVIVMVGLAFAFRLPRRTVALTAALLALFIVQALLPGVERPEVSALHGVNALLLVILDAYLVATTWPFARRP